MKRGRPALAIPTVEWKLRIPYDIALKIDAITADPLRGGQLYGARSDFVARILRRELDTLINRDDNIISPTTPQEPPP